MAIDLKRLRLQALMNQDAQGVVDIGGPIGGGSNYGPDDQEYEPPPQYDTGEEYSYGGNNQPTYEDPDEEQYASPVMDPRTPVNPTIAQPVAGPGSRGASDADELLKIINGIFTPEYTSRDRLNRLLDAAPEREGPGITRTIGGTLMGLGAKDPLDAMKVMEGTFYAPHHRNMADWTAKTGPFGNAAQYENTANINERTLAGNVGTQIVNQRRYDDQNRINEEKNRIAEFNAESRRIRDEAYSFAQRLGKGYDFDYSGPTIKVGNKSTGDMVDTGLSSGKLSEEAKISLQNAGRLAVVNQQGANQMAVQGSRNAGQLAVQTLRNQRVTGNGSTRGLLPSQQKDAYYNKAQEWIRRNPQDADYITLEPTQRDFSIEEPGTSIFGNPRGMPPERYDAFIDYIYGSGAMPAAAPSGMPTPPAAPALPQGAGPQAPAMPGQPQGQLTVPSRDDPRFQTPPGFDPHGRPPASQGQPFPYAMENAPAQPMVTQQARDVTTPPPELQTIVQLDQQIAQLKAQLAAPPPQYAPNQGSVAGTDNSIVGQRFRQNAGMPPTPTSGAWWPQSQTPPMGSISDRSTAMTAGQVAQQGIQAQQIQQAQQQQIQAKIAELEQQRQTALATLQAPAQPTPELQQRAVQHLQKLGLPVTPGNIAHAIKVGDVR